MDHGSVVYSFSFFFVVPLGNEGLDVSKPLLCQILPPTFEITALYSDPVSVTYRLHSFVQYRKKQDANLEVVQTTDSVEKSQVVQFLPYADMEPPTHIACFPEQFVLDNFADIGACPWWSAWRVDYEHERATTTSLLAPQSPPFYRFNALYHRSRSFDSATFASLIVARNTCDSSQDILRFRAYAVSLEANPSGSEPFNATSR